MSLLDIIILLPLAYFGYKGFKNGIVKEILGIVGIILAVFLTFEYMDLLASLIRPYFSEDVTYVPFVSGLILFIGTIAIVELTAWLTKKMLEKAHLNMVNRLLGLTFSVLKISLIISGLLIIMAGFQLPDEETRSESVTYPYMLQVAPVAYNTVATIYPGAEDFAATIKKSIDENNPINNFPIFN